MKASNLFRVVAVAAVLSTLSFAAGVAGDLSLADGPTSGTRVVLRIPPELPPDTARAAPLPLVRTSAAEAREAPRTRAMVRPMIVVAHLEPLELTSKPPQELALLELPKLRSGPAPKRQRRKAG